MTALYLHNAVHTPESADSSRSPFPHSRNISTISGTTLQAQSDHSHPNDPLLPSRTSDSLAYIDLFSHQPTLLNESGPLDWGSPPALLGDPQTLREKKSLWERSIRKRLKRLRLLMRGFETIFGVWAIYNTTRYFIAFTTYDSAEGQIVSLSLGICTGISFALLSTAVIFNFFKLHLLIHAVPLKLITFITLASLCASSLTLIAPAIINIVMLFVWRNRSDQELSTSTRCMLDIDVTWAASKDQCTAPFRWGTWMALSGARLGITVALVVLYYSFLISYGRTRRPAKWVNPKNLNRHRCSQSTQSAIPPPTTEVSSTLTHPPLQHQTSQSTVVSNIRLKESISAGTLSESKDASHSSAVDSNVDLEREPLGMVDRFRSLVTQITRETDQAISLSRSDGTSGTSETSSDSSDSGSLNDGNREFYPPPIPPTIGYNEFGQPYPAEESVPILNGYIRRMPTIESMGSREIASTNRASSLYSSSFVDRFGGTINSRPPTRNTLSRSDYTGSEPPSRPGSVSMRGPEQLGSGPLVYHGMTLTNEVGELLRTSTPEKRSSPLSANFNNSALTAPQPENGLDNHSRSSRGSATTAYTYYTATVGSASSAQSSIPRDGIHIPDS